MIGAIALVAPMALTAKPAGAIIGGQFCSGQQHGNQIKVGGTTYVCTPDDPTDPNSLWRWIP